MANKPIIMNKIKQIIRLHTEGCGSKRISLLSGISKNSVKRYLKKFKTLNLIYEDIEKLEESALQELFYEPNSQQFIPDTERYLELNQELPDIVKHLRKKGMTLAKMYHKYIEKHPNGYGHSQFYRYIQEYRKRSGMTMHIDYKAGEKVFIDFCGDKLKITDAETGEEKQVEVFVGILGCSQYTYVEATLSQTINDFINCCKNMFEFYSGVPRAVVPDNLKAAVTKSSRYEPIINATFGSFAEHYNTSILPARSYRPKDKALVENAVRLVYQRIYTELDGKIFLSLKDLNTAILIALDKHNRAPLKQAESRFELFIRDEKHELLALPQLTYEVYQIKEYRVMKNCYVTLHEDKHYYSVPYEFIGKRVRIVYNSLSVKIYHQYKLIATHERNYKKNRYTTDQEHLASKHKYMSDWNTDYFIEKAKAISDEVAKFMELLIESKPHPEMAYKACNGVLNLARRVEKERINNACKKAMKYGLIHYYFLEDVLKKGLENDDDLGDEIDGNNSTQNKPTPPHDNLRGKKYYE
ncbi:MAG: IS21 family transposase [Sphingobacteriales bacterium]|jgi:transposase|nr:IS21 family transposase [Sphingobacteriales bacterium]